MQMSYPVCEHVDANFLLFRQWEQSALNTRRFITEPLNAKHALAQLSPTETYASRNTRIKGTVAVLTQLNDAIHLYTLLCIAQR